MGSRKDPSLRTSKDIYDRIKWDFLEPGASSAADYWIGYEDRFEGMKEITFAEFQPGGDIPWHRVYYFRKGSDLLWDRRVKLDKIFGSGLHAPSPRRDQRMKKSGKREKKDWDATDLTETCPVNVDWPEGFELQPSRCFNYEPTPRQWRSGSPIPFHFDGSQLRVVSLNVLFGLYELGALTRETERWPLISAALRDSHAHVICLQEVTQRFLDYLLAETWVAGTYCTSTLVIDTYGQVVLSVFSIIETRLLLVNQGKHFLGVVLRTSNDVHLKVINVHLTSTKNEADSTLAKRGSEKRLQQASLALTAAAVGPMPCILVGDWNFCDQAIENVAFCDMLIMHGVRDAWKDTNAHLPGFTFDPQTNAVAALTAQRHFEPRRLDRILLRSGADAVLSPHTMCIFANQPATFLMDSSPLFPSDHYGLQLDFEIKYTPNPEPAHSGASLDFETKHTSNLQSSNPLASIVASSSVDNLSTISSVNTSALCLIPPAEGPLYLLVQRIRTLYDASCNRWPPHINILYGFLPEEHYAAAAPLIMRCLDKWSATGKTFEVVFQRFGIFDHGQKAYVFLYPDVLPMKTRKVMFFPKGQAKNIDKMQFDVCNRHDLSHPLSELYCELSRVFSQCAERDVLVPHLTVGTFASVEQAKIAATTWQTYWQPCTCQFSALSLISRHGAEPFSLKRSIPWTSTDSKPTAFTHACIKELRERCAEALVSQLADRGVRAKPLWLGSVVLETDFANSDADLCLCTSEQPFCVIQHLQNNPVFKLDTAMLRNEYSEALGISSMRLWHWVKQGDNSVLHLARYEEANTRAVQVEVSFASLPSHWLDELDDLLDWPDERLMELDAGSMLALSGVRDAMIIGRLLGEQLPLFREVVKRVKQWACARKIDRKAFGYPPAIAWTCMMAHVFLRTGHEILDEQSALETFFAHYAKKSSYDPLQGAAVAITDESMNAALHMYDRAHGITKGSQHMCVMGPTFPFNNQCRNVTASITEILRAELKRGLTLVHTADLCKPLADTDFVAQYPWFVHVELSAVDRIARDTDDFVYPENFPPAFHGVDLLPCALRIAWRQLEAHFIGLIIRLEKEVRKEMSGFSWQQALVHPLAKAFVCSQSNTVSAVFGLNCAQPDHSRIERLLADFIANYQVSSTIDGSCGRVTCTLRSQAVMTSKLGGATA